MLYGFVKLEIEVLFFPLTVLIAVFVLQLLIIRVTSHYAGTKNISFSVRWELLQVFVHCFGVLNFGYHSCCNQLL